MFPQLMKRWRAARRTATTSRRARRPVFHRQVAEALENRILLSDLKVLAVRGLGSADHPFDSLEVLFSEPVQAGSFTAADVFVVDGFVSPTAITAIDGSSYRVEIGRAHV